MEVGNEPTRAGFRAGTTPFRQFIRMFVVTLVIQTFHMAEHVAQTLQRFAFNSASAHGLIGALDVEQVHFAFNLLYLGTLFYITLGWLNFGRRVCSNYRMLGALLVGSTLFQSYHMAEHSVKLVQFLNTGIHGTPGILGMHFEGVIFHAVMNTAVYLPVVVVFLCSGMHRHVFSKQAWD